MNDELNSHNEPNSHPEQLKSSENTTSQKASPALKKANPSLCWGCRFATGLPFDETGASGAIPKTLDPRYALNIKPGQSTIKSTQTIQTPSQPKYTHCPWAAKLHYVEGWEIIVGPSLNENNPDEESVQVVSCPYYKPDLAAQIEALSISELAKYIDLPENFVKRCPRTIRKVLFTYYQRKGYYEDVLSTSPSNAILMRAMANIDFEPGDQCSSASSLLREYLPPYPLPINEKVRDVTLKEMIALAKVDTEDDPSSKDLPSIPILKSIQRLIEKMKHQKHSKEGN